MWELTSSEGGALALLIKGVGQAFRGPQHLLVGGFEALAEELQGPAVGCCHASGEPDPGKQHRIFAPIMLDSCSFDEFMHTCDGFDTKIAACAP